MSSSPLTLAGRLSLDPSSWRRGLADGERQTRTFSGVVRREMGELNRFLGGTAAKMAAFGGGFALGVQIVKSAGLDKTLTQIGQTAGATRDQVRALRGEIFSMAGATGRATDDLVDGFNILVQSGLQWNESRATLDAINKTMAVTGAQADTLAGSLGVASTAFQFDLSKPKLALGLLDRMTVAGRLGNAELENLGSIFSRVGVNAKGAGFGFDQTLAFIEGLSMIERQPERLATLADSTMRLFTNARYMAAAQKASGIRFFDKASGARRDPLEILADFKKRMDKMTTDAQREGFLAKAFGNADIDTIKGLRTLLQGNSLAKINDFTKQIGEAGGTIERDLPAAISNAVDQTGRLKARLKDAADAFIQPINRVYTNVLSKALGNGNKDSGLSNGQLFGAGVGTLLGAYTLKRVAGGLLGRLLGGAGNLAGGVAIGTALEKAGAATPVFIVGAAPGVFAGGGAAGVAGDVAAGALLGKMVKIGAVRAALAGAPIGALATSGLAGAATVAAGAGAAGVAGYGAGSLLYNHAISGTELGDSIGRSIAKVLGLFGNDNARAALRAEIDVNVNDNLTTARVRGRDFQNVQSTVNTRAARTGRMMEHRS
jgi:hypothetical protein